MGDLVFLTTGSRRRSWVERRDLEIDWWIYKKRHLTAASEISKRVRALFLDCGREG